MKRNNHSKHVEKHTQTQFKFTKQRTNISRSKMHKLEEVNDGQEPNNQLLRSESPSI
jgi:hypothetical protein